MGREVRRVPEGWEHPRYRNGGYIPLFDGKKFSKNLTIWHAHKARWEGGLVDDFDGGWKKKTPDQLDMLFSDWYGSRPDPADYMPEWPESECTHLMMYESTSEGTPISPAFETPEELARWLADNKASSFGEMTANYEQWLATCKSGWAPSAVLDAGGIHSGIEFISNTSGN